MQTRTREHTKEKPTQQRLFSEVKDKELVLHCLKVYKNKTYDDTCIIKEADIKKVEKLKVNDYETIKKMFSNTINAEGLALDSKSEKANLCKHARGWQRAFNLVAKHANRKDLLILWGNKSKEKNKATQSKATKKTNKQTKQRVKAKVKKS